MKDLNCAKSTMSQSSMPLRCQRDLFSIPEGHCYLNSAFMGPLPRLVDKAGVEALSARAAPVSMSARDFFIQLNGCASCVHNWSMRTRSGLHLFRPPPTLVRLLSRANWRSLPRGRCSVCGRRHSGGRCNADRRQATSSRCFDRAQLQVNAIELWTWFCGVQ